MSVHVIEGKVVEAPVKFSRRGIVRFEHLTLARTDGQTERIAKPVTTAELAEAIVPGAEGRFYLYKVLDVRGIHGVRLADGTALYAYPGQNVRIFLLVVVMSLAWLALRFFDRGDLPILGLILFAFGAVGYFLTHSNRAETLRQFEGDAAFEPARRSAPE